MAELNAEQFFNRTSFITESDEEELKNGIPLTFDEVPVYAIQEMEAPMEYFVGVSLMLESDIPSLGRLVDQSGEQPTIETDDIIAGDIRSVICNNGEDSEGTKITNVPSSLFFRLSPGDLVKVKVRMSQDENGEWYLNGQLLDVQEREGSTTEATLNDALQEAGAQQLVGEEE